MDYLSKLKAVLTPEQMRFFELLGPPSLVAGEDAARYCGFVAAIFQAVQPQDVQDFIYQRDLIDLEWDVLRYRTAKAQLITNAKISLTQLTSPTQLQTKMMRSRPGSWAKWFLS